MTEIARFLTGPRFCLEASGQLPTMDFHSVAAP